MNKVEAITESGIIVTHNLDSGEITITIPGPVSLNHMSYETEEGDYTQFHVLQHQV